MVDEEVKKLIEENPVAFSTCVDDKPNVIAVACVKVVSENQIIITDNYMVKTRDNLNKNNNVCLAVWGKDEKGYKLIGTAEYLTEGEWLDFVKNMEENKEEPAKGAILVTVNQVIKLS